MPVVRRTYVVGYLSAARAVGQLLLRTFYGGDLAAYRRMGTEHASLQALARHDDLRVPAAALWDGLRLVEQLDVLPDDLEEVLTISHHRALFRVRDTRAKVRLARAVAREALRVEDLRERVTAVVGADPRGRGRKRQPRLAKTAKAVHAVTQVYEDAPVTAADVRALDARQLDRTLMQLDAEVERLRAITAAVRRLARSERR